MKKLVIYIVLLGALSAVLYVFLAQTERSTFNRISPVLNPVFRECANENAIAMSPGNSVDMPGLTEPQKHLVLGCVLESVANEGLPEVALKHMQAIFGASPSLKDPAVADLLIPALFGADTLEAAKYLVRNTSVLEVTDIRQMSHERFFGLAVTQYQALRNNMDIVEYLTTEGFSFSANDNSFVHTIYDVQKYRFLSAPLRALLLQHHVDIDALDESGKTVAARAIADGEHTLNDAFLELGAIPAEQTAGMANQAPPEPEAPDAITYSLEQHLRADPLPINTEETLFLYDRDRTVYAELWNWRTDSGKPHRLQLASRDHRNKPIKYYTAATQHGFWVLGPKSILISPDGETKEIAISLLASQGRHIVVALDDGSLLIVGESTSNSRYMDSIRVYLSDPGRGEIETTPTGSPERIASGSVAGKLSDGRVLIVGGRFSGDARSWLYDPKADQWSEQGKISTHRYYPAIGALPDGRAFIAGNSSLAYAGNESTPPSAYSAELWDPETGQWTPLPAMPLSYRTEAYHAEGSSAATLPDGSLILVGGMHNQVMLLRAHGDRFADHWAIVGSTEQQRVGAKAQTLGMNTVAVLGGAGLSPSDQCCWTVSGGERIEIHEDGTAYSTNVGLTQNGAAIAHRGTQTFIAGGWQQYSLGSQTVQGSGVAEIIDNITGLTRPLPPLPSPALIAQALWLDEHHILVKAKKPMEEFYGERKQWDSRSMEASFAGYLALLDTRSGQWHVEKDPQIARSELAGKNGNEVILIGPDVDNWAVDLDDLSIRKLPPRIAEREGAVVRITRDGRTIIAGGMAQKKLLLAENSACTDEDCPQEWFAYGGVRPSNRYEIWDPAADEWRLSATREGRGTSATILDDGRVFASGWNGERWLIEVSDSSGKQWQTLPMPDEIAAESARETPSCGDESRYGPSCSLFTGVFGDTDLVILRSDYWGKRNDSSHALWLYDEIEKRWLLIAQGLSQQELNMPRALPLEFEGKPVHAAYFATSVPRVWQE